MRSKLNIRFIAMGVLTLVLTFIVMFAVFDTVLKRDAIDGLMRETKMTAKLLETDDNDMDMLKYAAPKLRITLLSGDGTIIFDSDEGAKHTVGSNIGRRPEIEQALNGEVGEAERISNTTGKNSYYCAIKLNDGSGRVLRLATDADSVELLLMESMPTLAAVLAAILAVSVLISFLLSKRMVGWLSSMLKTMDEDPFAPTLSELEPVACVAREQYLKRYENEKARREFTANVSHELKTPLTSISGYAEMMENGMARDGDVKQFAKNIHEESGRLITLIGDIIKLTELEENADMPDGGKAELVDLYEIAADTMERLAFNAERAGVTMRLEGEHCTMHGNKQQLCELIYNLCDNAIRYNRRGGSVTVSVKRDADNAVLRVVATGIGRPVEHRSRIFERFYRVDKSHSRQSGGTGLGLAIVKHVAIRHNAIISIKDAVGGGTEMRVDFPL